MAIEIVAIALRVAAIIVGAELGDDLTAVALFAIAGIIVNVTIMGIAFARTTSPSRSAVGPRIDQTRMSGEVVLRYGRSVETLGGHAAPP